jgi:hypothetical protein
LVLVLTHTTGSLRLHDGNIMWLDIDEPDIELGMELEDAPGDCAATATIGAAASNARHAVVRGLRNMTTPICGLWVSHERDLG